MLFELPIFSGQWKLGLQNCSQRGQRQSQLQALNYRPTDAQKGSTESDSVAHFCCSYLLTKVSTEQTGPAVHMSIILKLRNTNDLQP
jgi:hypothetical protein